MLIDLIILSFLRNRPKHGYEIKKDVAFIMGQEQGVNNNTLYPALHRLERMGAVRGITEQQDGKPNRRVYEITDAGKEIFPELIAEFSPADAQREFEFLARVSFFDLVSDRVRLDILAKRKRVVSARIAHRNSIDRQYPVERESVWVQSLFKFQYAQLSAELAWIDQLESEARAYEAPAHG